MTRAENPKRDAEEGFAYVGLWWDGTLGWSMPQFIAPVRRSERNARKNVHRNSDEWAKGEPHYLCRIKMEIVRDSLGRPIVHYPGGKPATGKDPK